MEIPSAYHDFGWIAAGAAALTFLRALLPGRAAALYHTAVAAGLSAAHALACGGPWGADLIEPLDAAGLGIIRWAALMYIAYSLCESVIMAADALAGIRPEPLMAVHHAIALIAYLIGIQSTFGVAILAGVLMLEYSSILLNLRDLVERGTPARAVIDVAFAAVYLWVRAWVYPSVMYQLFYVDIYTIPPEYAPDPTGFVVGRATCQISVVINYVWCCGVVRLAWRRLAKC
jgi:hypothetical protein